MSNFTTICISDTSIRPGQRKKMMALHPCLWINVKAQSDHHLATSRMINARWHLAGVRVGDRLRSQQERNRRVLGCHRWIVLMDSMSKTYLTWLPRVIPIRCLGFPSSIRRILSQIRDLKKLIEIMDSSRITGRIKARKGSIRLLPVITIASLRLRNPQKSSSTLQSVAVARLTLEMKTLMTIRATPIKISSHLTSKIQSIARSITIPHTSSCLRWSVLVTTEVRPMMRATLISQV